MSNVPLESSTDNDSMLGRGLELARRRADLPDVAAGLEQENGYHFPPTAGAFADWLDQNDSNAPSAPTPEDEAEAAAMFGAMTAAEYLGRSDRLTLAELIDRQVDFYRDWGNPAGAMFAEAMDRLAMQVRLTDAATPAELVARVDELEADIRNDWESRGYLEGLAAGRAEGRGHEGPLD